MKFGEFVRKNKNVIENARRIKITQSIPISEDREKFYTDQEFHKHDLVQSDGQTLRILEKCSNYYTCVDVIGNIVKKFATNLTVLKEESKKVWTINPISFHGYTPSKTFQEDDQMRQLWEQKLNDHNDQSDDIALLKELKTADKIVQEGAMDSEYKLRDKLTIAKIIADAVGIPHDPASTPENLVNAAIKKAKKDPQLMRNKVVLTNMLQIAKSVGIRFSDTTFEPVQEAVLNEDPLNAWKNRMKMAGAVHYISGKHPSGSVSSKLHAYKIVDGKKIKVGTFDQVMRRGLQEEKSAKFDYHQRMYLKAIKIGNSLLAKHHADIRDSLREEKIQENYLTLKDLLQRITIDNSSTSSSASDQASDELPHGHSFNPTSDTHRKQLIQKLADH